MEQIFGNKILKNIGQNLSKIHKIIASLHHVVEINITFIRFKMTEK
jgi:hypothetical protein